MTCEQLSDRMPAVARGMADWTPADEAHLRTCADCAAEWSLVRGATALGGNLGAFDAGRVADRVIAGLRAPVPRRAAIRRLQWAVPVALAASLFLLLGRSRMTGGNGANPAAATVSLLPEADPLSDAELETVLRLLPSSEPVDVGGPEDLNDEEVTQMMQDLEG
jgi:hypothetical protein